MKDAAAVVERVDLTALSAKSACLIFSTVKAAHGWLFASHAAQRSAQRHFADGTRDTLR